MRVKVIEEIKPYFEEEVNKFMEREDIYVDSVEFNSFIDNEYDHVYYTACIMYETVEEINTLDVEKIERHLMERAEWNHERRNYDKAEELNRLLIWITNNR